MELRRRITAAEALDHITNHHRKFVQEPNVRCISLLEPSVQESKSSSPLALSSVLNRMKQFMAMQKMKKLALEVIAEKLSEEEIRGLKQFNRMEYKKT
ncbi:hypothetical protein TorRG33x02_103490 [Trema orientale]|uniref:Uncharacterized protein n=1 Tax=Trema orientale TaxID=63057 RepID=A0A2P5F863_TREOI|nr:hypothetical protein TorRG33x02_103490 [Trema orientale]